MKRMKLVNFGVALMMVAGFTIILPSSALAACPIDMAAYWKLGETGAPYREQITNNDGGVAAEKTAPGAVAGKVGGAQSFNGVDTAINVPASDAFNWAADDSFSIELWINIPSLPSANQVAVGRLASGATDRQWWVGVHGNTAGDRGKVQFSLLNSPTPVTNIISTTVLAPNIWYHVVVVRDGDQNRIYVNGILEATTQQAFPNGFSSTDAALNIGWLNRDPGFHFNGQIDELALYDRALTPTEIFFHYNDGAGNDYCAPAPLSNDAPFPDSTIALWPLDEETGSTIYVDVFGGNDGDIAVGKTGPGAVAGKVGGAQSFNGVDTAIIVPASDAFNWAADDSFSIELWINIPSLPGANQVAVGRLASGATTRQWWVGVHGNTAGNRGKVQFSLLNSPDPVTNIIGNTVLALNTWHHVVAVRDRNHHRIYLNGNLDLNNSQIGTLPNGFSSMDAALNIGWLNPGFHLNGQIDELALYDRALTPNEIKAHYDAGVAGNGVYALLPAPLAVAIANPATVKELQPFALDGTGSAPGYPEALIIAYLWEQTAGPTATLTNANTATASAVAPELTVDEATLTFQLTVTAEDNQSVSDTVSVQVLFGPVANAGSDQSVTVGDAVTLNGSGSTGTGLTFLWAQTAGTSVTLTGATTATATFTAPTLGAAASAETLAFQLTVTDQNGVSDSDTIEVTVNSAGTPASSGGGGGGGCFINTMF